MSKYYKAEDIFQVLDKIFQNAPEEVIEAIKSVDLVIEINKLPTIDSSGDCISREWIYDALLEYGFTAPDMTVTELIEDAPSVVPDFKTFCGVPIEEAIDVLEKHTTEQSSVVGEWLLDGRCSNCLQAPLTTHKTYCPNCGVKMKG